MSGPTWVWTKDEESGTVCLNGKKVLVSAHAVERLTQRLRLKESLDEDGWRTRVEELLLESELDGSIDKVQRIKREINNKFEKALYFINRQYNIRFVVVEDGQGFKVKTSEKPRPNFSGAPLFDKRAMSERKPRERWERRRVYKTRRNPYHS